jgi:hypothetical protein
MPRFHQLSTIDYQPDPPPGNQRRLTSAATTAAKYAGNPLCQPYPYFTRQKFAISEKRKTLSFGKLTTKIPSKAVCLCGPVGGW